MDKKLLILILLLKCINLYSQVEFQNHVVSDTSGHTSSVYACDLDGDGDLDFLVTSKDSISAPGTLLWYENIDGQGSFNVEHSIPTNFNDPRSVFAADLDGDDDIDVLSASINDDKVAWYENLDGLGNFSVEKIISINANQVFDVYAADLDGDGDMDVLSASINDDKVAWYENLDGLGNFSVEKIISINANQVFDVYAADLDGDGDMDVLSASINDDKVAWYENLDGLGSFSDEIIISTNSTSPKSVHASDIDGDGDMDVVSASQTDDKVAWYENLDGLGNFSDEIIISTNSDGAISVYSADLDGDNDMDVLVASQNNGKIAWFQNMDGQGNFGNEEPAIFYSYPASTVHSADIDGDGDMDVLSASVVNSIAWHENLLITSISDYSLTIFDAYPIPTDKFLNFKSESRIANIKIYNSLGQLVLTDTDQTQIDISTLSSGIYFCMVKDIKSKCKTIKVIKE